MFTGHTLVLLTGTDVDRNTMRFAALRAQQDGSRIFACRVHVDEEACQFVALTPYQFQGLSGAVPPYELEDTVSYASAILEEVVPAGSLGIQPVHMADVDSAHMNAFIREEGIGVVVASRPSGHKCDGEVCKTVRASSVPVVSLPITQLA
jgi:hypothetical protein